MWKRSKFLILFLMGILVGVGFYMGLHAARLYRPLPPPPAIRKILIFLTRKWTTHRSPHHRRKK